MKNIKKIVKENEYYISVIGLSLLTLIIGTLAFNFLMAFIVVALIDSILFIVPNAKKLKNFKIKGRKTSTKSASSNNPVKKKTKGENKTNKKKIWKIILIAGFSIFILVLTISCIFFYSIVKNSEAFDPNKLYEKEATVFYDNKGRVIAKVGNEIREKISYDEMPQVLIDAIIATEDSRFFQHNGFDLPRFLKASVGQVLGNSGAGGASTLTMQLSKKKYTSEESRGIEGIIRKFTDIYYAIFEIEKKYTKQEIIEFYANSNYLGNGAHGVEQASQAYFGKPAKDMNVSEAALIAGLFNAPDYLDPTKHPERAENRRKVVLSLMERHGYLTKEEHEIAKLATVDRLLKEQKDKFGDFQGFINTVTSEIIDKLGLDPYETPMEVYTTMDLDKQAHIDKIYSGETYKWEDDGVNAGVAVIDNKTGALVAVGAGRKTGAKVYNFATMAKRQIGSTAKPLYDYGPGIQYNNWSTYQLFADEPHSYSSGTVMNNWDNKFDGLMTLRDALKTSRNIPALKAFQSVSNKNIKEYVTSLGLSPENEGNIIHEAHAVGGYDGESPVTLAAAYSAYANGGYYIEPYSYTKVILRDSGKVHETKVQKTKVVDESTAYMITSVLMDAAKWGLYGNYNVNGVTYAAKTGTSNFTAATIKKYNLPATAINDFWIASYNPNYTLTQWYGYEELNEESSAKKYYNVFGSSIYRQLFQTIAKGIYTENVSFKKPNDVIEVAIEKDTNPAMLPSEFTPSNMIITELFKKGTEPTEVSPRYSQLSNPTNVDIKSNNNSLTISWDPIKTPDFINHDFLKTYYSKLFNDAGFLNSYVNNRIAYNNNNIGEIGYSVYLKNNNGLELLGFTKNNYYNYTPTTSGSVTIVVKSSYSIFKSNMSSGAESTYVFEGTTDVITSTMTGDATINLHVGDEYVEPKQSIVVNNNLDDVTSQATITKKITDKDGNTVDKIDTTAVNTYKITYTVKYKTYTKTHTRTVNIKLP